MELLGQLEFGPVIKPRTGMFVAYSGEYNNDVKLPYEIITVADNMKTVCLQNDFLDVSELFFINTEELQEILCTFDLPTDDISINKQGLFKKYKIEHRSFHSLDELTYIFEEGLTEFEICWHEEKIKLMGKNHIVLSTDRPKRKTITGMFEEVFQLLGIDSEPSNTINDLQTIINQLKTVNYIPYPVSLSTVDIVPYYINDKGNIFLLMGRKPGQKMFQFVGGFRDPKETNQFAASRELNEEACLELDLKRFKFQDTISINDRRYIDSVHKITTALFTVEITYDETQQAKGCDDMEEIQLFPLTSLIEEKDLLIRDVHHELFDVVVNIFLGRNQ